MILQSFSKFYKLVRQNGKILFEIVSFKIYLSFINIKFCEIEHRFMIAVKSKGSQAKETLG